MRILRSNLESALTITIRAIHEEDFTSCFEQGLKDILDALRRGEYIEVVA